MSGQGQKASASERKLAALQAVADHDSFTGPELASLTGLTISWARKTIREWMLSGVIAQVERGENLEAYRLAETAEQDTQYARESRRPEFGMWRTMRNLRRFSASDVHLTANTEATPVTVADIQKYCSTLAEAGYLKVAVKGRAGTRSAVYSIVGHPGPFPPRPIRVPAIYDPNKGEFVVLKKRVRP